MTNTTAQPNALGSLPTAASILAMSAATLAAWLAQKGKKTRRRRTKVYSRVGLEGAIKRFDGVWLHASTEAVPRAIYDRITRLAKGIHETLREDGGHHVELDSTCVAGFYHAALRLTRLGDKPPETQTIKAAPASARQHK